MSKVRTIAAILFALAALPQAVGAQEKTVALPFLCIGQDPSAASLAGVSLWSNPASEGFKERTGYAGLSYQKWGLSDSGFISAGGGYTFAEKFSARVFYTHQSEAPYQVIDSEGQDAGTFRPTAMKAGAGFSALLTDHLSAGIDMMYASRTLASGASHGAFAADLALMADYGGFSAAAGARRIGSKASGASIPSSAFVTAGYRYVLARKHALSASAEYEYLFYGESAVSAGLSYCFNDIVTVSGGYHMGKIIPSHASAGLGLNINGVALSASMLFGEEMGGTMLVGLGYEF